MTRSARGGWRLAYRCRPQEYPHATVLRTGETSTSSRGVNHNCGPWASQRWIEHIYSRNRLPSPPLPLPPHAFRWLAIRCYCCSDCHRSSCWVVCGSPPLHLTRVLPLYLLLIRSPCAPSLHPPPENPYRSISSTSWRSCRGLWTLPTALAPSTRASRSRSSVSPSVGTSPASS